MYQEPVQGQLSPFDEKAEERTVRCPRACCLSQPAAFQPNKQNGLLLEGVPLPHIHAICCGLPVLHVEV